MFEHRAVVISTGLNLMSGQILIPVLTNFENQLRASTMPVRVQLPLGLHTYLDFNTDIVNFV